MFKKEKNTITEIETPQLQSAEPAQEEYAPVLRVLLAVAYMGVLSAVIAAVALLLPLLSGQDVSDRLILSAAALVLFGAAAAVLSAIDKQKQRKYELQRQRLHDEAQRFNGNVVSCEKLTRSVPYGSQTYLETTWRFVIQYKDENEGTVTVKSGRYLNDISSILADDSVTVLKMSDDRYEFEDLHLIKQGEAGIALSVTECEEEEM